MKVVSLERKVLEKNQAVADRNRLVFQGNGILAINLLSSPGAGKTSLLEQTARMGSAGLRLGVLTGDPQTDRDGRRIAREGLPVVQIVTAGACHLNAAMVEKGLSELPLRELDFVVIENVGNLVCPAGYDLGERYKVVMLSTTEGEDKPLKYPRMFAVADLLIINKTDLLPHLTFDIDGAAGNALKVNPQLQVLRTSCKTSDGLDAWLEWVRARHQELPT
jgi:hydrogenase nickel incorporation protein HypB